MKKYLVMVADHVARQVVVEAQSAKEAFEQADFGEWLLPEDVEHEEVVGRMATEVLEERG